MSKFHFAASLLRSTDGVMCYVADAFIQSTLYTQQNNAFLPVLRPYVSYTVIHLFTRRTNDSVGEPWNCSSCTSPSPRPKHHDSSRRKSSMYTPLVLHKKSEQVVVGPTFVGSKNACGCHVHKATWVIVLRNVSR